MTLPSSGTISFGAIQTEFGGVNPIAMTEYYGQAPGIPGSGQISASQFYGKYKSTPSIEVLTVGGGAGGTVGGGGGGGVYSFVASVTQGTNYSILVGAGGTAGASGGVRGTAGGVSSFNGIGAVGGGAGGAYSLTSSASGGNGVCGGGGGIYYPSRYSYTTYDYTDGGVSTDTSKGKSGGRGVTFYYTYAAGGGGGASGAGVSGSISYNSITGTVNAKAGNGGTGFLSAITGTNVYYGGGGGGGVATDATGLLGYSVNKTAGLAGSGGGGAGGTSATNGTSGTANFGGGGGGCNPFLASPGSGGSGVVILRYPNSYPTAAAVSGSVTYSNVGGYHLYKFTSVGSIRF